MIPAGMVLQLGALQGKSKVCTIEGYKSAIVATLKAKGINVGTNPHICRLINSFYMDRMVETILILH